MTPPGKDGEKPRRRRTRRGDQNEPAFLVPRQHNGEVQLSRVGIPEAGPYSNSISGLGHPRAMDLASKIALNPRGRGSRSQRANPVGVCPTRQDPALWAKGRNRRHIVDYQALKVQHLAQHWCNRGATFCSFPCPSRVDELFGFPPSQSLRTAGPGNGGCAGAARWRLRGKTKDNAPNGSCHYPEKRHFHPQR